MSIIDILRGRKNITYEQGQGIHLLTRYINQYEGRRFRFKGLKRIYSGLSPEELLIRTQEEMDNMMILYRYMTTVKQYVDHKGISHCNIRIIGKAGMLSRYNMLDIELHIRTE